MIRSLWISKTGMEGQQTQLDVIANNLANVGTNGYKRADAVFEDLMYQNLRQAGASSTEQSAAAHRAAGRPGRARRWRTTRNFTQGNLQQTGDNLRHRDQGQRLLPGADARRHHRLHARRRVPGRRQGQLVTTTGYAVQPGITIPANALSVTVAADGTVSVTTAGPADAAGSWASCSWPASSTRPAWSRAAEPLCRDRRLGHAERRRAGQRRPGLAAAGLRRDAATSTWSRNWSR